MLPLPPLCVPTKAPRKQKRRFLYPVQLASGNSGVAGTSDGDGVPSKGSVAGTSEGVGVPPMGESDGDRPGLPPKGSVSGETELTDGIMRVGGEMRSRDGIMGVVGEMKSRDGQQPRSICTSREKSLILTMHSYARKGSGVAKEQQEQQHRELQFD